MPNASTQLRKAAILIRSLDADGAAAVLARLSPEEARQVRLAIQSLGEVDADERDDVSAEFCRSGSVARENPRHGVELELSSELPGEPAYPMYPSKSAVRPFEFLEQARVESLVPYLAREQAQTVAVVLSYLTPPRAAEVLAAMPEKLQAATIERLSLLGETDPDTLQVLERELAEWLARQHASRTRPTQRIDTVNAILSAADQRSRGQILANLLKHNRELANQIAPSALPRPAPAPTIAEQIADCGSQIADLKAAMTAQPPAATRPPSAIRNPQPEIPLLHFDDLTRFDAAGLAAVLKGVDSELLVLALVGASDELVAHVTAPMPPKVAKAFRGRLHRCGPTRLSDVEAAQHEVARIASQIVHARRESRRSISAKHPTTAS
ncbi:MAG: FliG C-terminal domain-containing protein [Pirellulales bacterium]